MKGLCSTIVWLLIAPCWLQASAPTADCNDNSIPDDQEIAHGQALDCNENAVPDECDVDAGTSGDCNSNDIPDECDTLVSFTEETIDSGLFVMSVGSDLDGDGDPDIVASFYDESSIVWYENLGAGGFGERRLVGYTEDEEIPSRLFAGDLDGDGDNDILHGTVLGVTIGWHENLDGLGTFGPLRVIDHVVGSGQIVLSVLAADFDGDEDLDVVASWIMFRFWMVMLYENTDGRGTFGPGQVISGPYTPPAQGAAADLDGDEDVDLVWAFSNGIAWFENLDGAGTFSVALYLGDAAGEIADAADLDGDGDADVLASQDPGGVGWFENLDGGGTFGPHQSFADATARHLDTADLDRDGDLDVVWVSADDPPGVVWHENTDGAGTFGPEQVLTDATSNSVFALDADGDLDQDLLAVLWSDSKIVLFRNDGNDCNTNGVPDSCDTASGTSVDCNANFLLDECESSCTTDCDADFDNCADDLDCDPTDGAVWSDPGPIGSLILELQGDVVRLSWQAPVHPGATSVVYDTLRSSSPSDFHGPAICIEEDGLDLVAEDLAAAGTSETYYYLIRDENACPGGIGSMGAASSGAPRTGLSCPQDY